MGKKTIIIIILLAMLTGTHVVAGQTDHDPGHYSLYVVKVGDSNITGSINISDTLTAELVKLNERIFGPYLEIRADGTTSTAANRIVGINGELQITSLGDLKLNPGAAGTVYVGETSETALVVTGSIQSQGQSVCLANGTGCPASLGGANITGSGVADRLTYWQSSDTIAALSAGSTGQILRSGGAGLASWSTAAYPSTVDANQALYATSNNVIGAGTLPIAAGGTAAITASSARFNLGAAGIGVCPSGEVVQNITTSGVECAAVDIPDALPSGTAGQTLRHDGGDWVVTSNLYHNGTHVGIGTSNPGAKLDVDGSFRAGGNAEMKLIYFSENNDLGMHANSTDVIIGNISAFK